MPDLIIKPAAQSGNKVIIQDQAGGAVITTADSGATIANATLTSPTLNSPTLVTPALGTVTSGNLSNTAIVYPSGHVIQVVSTHFDGVWDTSGTGWATVTGFSATMTPSLGTKILVFINLVTGGTTFNQLQLKRDGTSIGNATAAGSRQNSMFGTGQIANYVSVLHMGFNYLDTHGANGSTSVTYQLEGHNQNGGTTYIGRSGRDNDSTVADPRHPSVITIMEIAQ
jgi:hypothetical protein